MSIETIYEQYIKPLPHEQQLLLLAMLGSEGENGATSKPRRNILELHGLGKEIWQGVDADEYVSKLRDEWEEREERMNEAG